MVKAISNWAPVTEADSIPVANPERPGVQVFLKGWAFPPFSRRSKARPGLVALSVQQQPRPAERPLAPQGSQTSYARSSITGRERLRVLNPGPALRRPSANRLDELASSDSNVSRQ